jgi:hypothetical protein
MRIASFVFVALLPFELIAASACAGPPAAPVSPATLATASQPPVSDVTTPGRSTPAREADGHPGEKRSPTEDDVVALLPSSKLGLAEGIALAEQAGATAISAKFELSEGKLSLSIYTAKLGLEPDAEHNILAELSGDPTQPEWEASEEIFSDTAHLARASYHLTLVQRSRMSLTSVIAKALAKQPGRVYSVEPAVRERSPIFHVAIATPGGGHVTVDIASGA